jgi:DNA modification methylase
LLRSNLLASHPTVKPVAMIADAIMDATARRDIVLDGFLGSGSNVIAEWLKFRQFARAHAARLV